MAHFPEFQAMFLNNPRSGPRIFLPSAANRRHSGAVRRQSDGVASSVHEARRQGLARGRRNMAEDPTSILRRQRSRLSNGEGLLPNIIDMRSAIVRRYREIWSKR